MGNILNGRQNGRIEEVESNGSNAYCYPPKNGHYFGSHFIMGGERFETCSPEAYLFGENMDLNFLGSHPTPFPYSAPLPHEPTRTLRALINIRKESLRLIKIASNGEDIKETTQTESEPIKESNRYNLEFIFDADVKCCITIHYLCTEDMTPNGIIYTPKDPSFSSETYHYKRGANQLFSQSSHVFNPLLFSDEELMYRSIDEKGEFDSTAPLPVVIQCVAEEGEEPRQSHILIAIIERNHENTHSIKPLKQKLFVDGLTYLLQEIYGIENKNMTLTTSGDPSAPVDDDLEDNSSECVICMSDARDTLILPCRHLCLCNGCAESLRYQANNCPICRAPFRALLQLKAVRKSFVANSNSVANHHQMMSSNSSTDLVDIPPGYEPFSLIEALNGPNPHSNGYSYRITSNETETPINVRKYQKNEQKSKKSNQTNGTNPGSEIHENVSVSTITPIARSRVATASPTTPEVVVSGMPVSPDKEVDENDSNIINSEIKEREIWCSRIPIVSNCKTNKPLADDSGSASSSASSGTAENIALQERVRLLSNDKEDDSDYLNEREDKNNEETELQSFRMNAMSPSMLKDSPGNSSPLSIGVSSASYPMISLRDGIDEQRVMDADADLLSVATISSTNNTMIRPEDDSSDYFIPFDDKNEFNCEIEGMPLSLNNGLLIGENTNLDTPQVWHKIFDFTSIYNQFSI